LTGFSCPLNSRTTSLISTMCGIDCHEPQA
jgi:hypothetical protein